MCRRLGRICLGPNRMDQTSPTRLRARCAIDAAINIPQLNLTAIHGQSLSRPMFHWCSRRRWFKAQSRRKGRKLGSASQLGIRCLVGVPKQSKAPALAGALKKFVNYRFSLRLSYEILRRCCSANFKGVPRPKRGTLSL